MIARFFCVFFIALIGLQTADAQASSMRDVPPRARPSEIRACEQAMLDSSRRQLSVPGYASNTPIGGFMREGRASCDYVAFYRLWEQKQPKDAPTPIFSSVHPPCPAGWGLGPERNSTRCVRIDGTTTPRFFVRVVSGEGEKWADSRNCLALVDVLNKMETVLTPEFTGDKPFPRFPLVNDGMLYKIWAGDLDLGAYGQLARMGSNVGSALSKWAEESLATLRPCLSPDLPKP